MLEEGVLVSWKYTGAIWPVLSSCLVWQAEERMGRVPRSQWCRWCCQGTMLWSLLSIAGGSALVGCLGL